ALISPRHGITKGQYSENLPDYERLKNLNLPAALKATYLTKTIENQSDNELSERYQSQNDTGIKMTPVSKRDQYQDDTSIEMIPVSKQDQYQNDTSIETTPVSKRDRSQKEKKQPEPIKIKEIPDTVSEKLKFKPGFFSQWETSIFNELRKILSNSEFKIYTVLFENSWAFGKNITSIIGYQTIAEKTGLSRATVIRSIEKLIKRKIIEKRTSFNNLGTIYKVNLPEGAEIQPNEIQSRGESTFTQDDDESTLTQSPPAQSTLPLLDVPDEEKFIFENNLIKVKTQEEIIKTLKSKPFSLKDDIIQQIIKTTSPQLISLKIENALFNYHKNLIKKPGEWLILSIFNKYKTSKQFLKHLKGKLEANARANPDLPRPLDEHLIKTVFGYYTKWLRVIPTKETLIKELERYNIPDQMINDIIKTYPPEYIFFQIKHADSQAHKLKDPTAWLINAIQKVYKPSREFAKKIETQIKQLEEERKQIERERELQQEKMEIERALNYFKTLPEKNQKELIKIAEDELKKLNITPETPGYKTNLDFKIAQLIKKLYNT
ncbi:hypothetical protein, partial [Candidatus Kryptonium thompsonii]|uniref:hypothetical protein n=1 Tax=Candidatus Kryptonium thompsonii TaxID=1633631 RepID=UPI000707A827